MALVDGHGSAAGYRTRHCRCERCRAWNASRNRLWRAHRERPAGAGWTPQTRLYRQMVWPQRARILS